MPISKAETILPMSFTGILFYATECSGTNPKRICPAWMNGRTFCNYFLISNSYFNESTVTVPSGNFSNFELTHNGLRKE